MRIGAGGTPALAIAALLTLPAAGCAQEESSQTAAPSAIAASTGSITDVAGIEVGHHTLDTRPTGCTVILSRGGAVGGVDVRGGAPGTRDTDLLDPVNLVQEVHGVVLSGGSLFGLDAVSGAVRWLEERGTGLDAWGTTIPIVTGAILFDLGIGDSSIRPGADCGYAAAEAATGGHLASGSIGAGAGATVGKLAGMDRAMKGGIGTASVELPGGVVVAAIVAVNSVGDVVDPATGQVVAGIRNEDGTGFSDARQLIYTRTGLVGASGENTTIGVVATNATLTKAQAIARDFAAEGTVLAAGFDELTSGHDIILNATSTGLFGTRPEVSDDVFDGAALAYELVYGKGLTGFLQQAQDVGVPALADGVGMLVEQAAEAYAWWRGKRPETAALIEEMTVPLT